MSEVSKRFGIGQASVVRWSKKIEPQETRKKPTPKMNWEALIQDIDEHPESYQSERATHFGVSQQGMAYTLKKLKISRKKKRFNTQKPTHKPSRASKLKLMGKVNSDVFFAWITQELLPKLPSTCVIVMDNASFHKRLDIQDSIRQAGHLLLFLPPYSPQLNPIEHQ